MVVAMSFVRFEVPGEPQGKGRARVGRARVGRGPGMFTPAKTVAYEGLIALAAQQAMDGKPMMQGACAVLIDAYCSVPASWPKKKRAAALAGDVYPTSKPDVDNIAKAVGDGANGVVWADDKQIADLRIRRRYAAVPLLAVDVMELSA